MKRLIAFALALALCFALCACGSSNKKAFEASKAAYDQIDQAYEIVDQISSDIYEAWRMGIYEDDEILDSGVAYLATELDLTEDELLDGVAHFISTTIYEENWNDLTADQKADYRDDADFAFTFFEDDLFSFCIAIVISAYTVRGDMSEAESALNTAKEMMKNLSENYSDYEHYPNLKGYYTTTSSFFDFCQDPSGSFEQVKTTINDYRNEARDYISDLDYIFEE